MSQTPTPEERVPSPPDSPEAMAESSHEELGVFAFECEEAPAPLPQMVQSRPEPEPRVHGGQHFASFAQAYETQSLPATSDFASSDRARTLAQPLFALQPPAGFAPFPHARKRRRYEQRRLQTGLGPITELDEICSL